MSTQQAYATPPADTESESEADIEIESLPTEIDTTGPKLIYLYLDVAREATIDELATTLNMTKLTLYSMVDTLESEGLVECDGETLAAAE